jgi:ABC-type phosphate transport system substrate-binding protein
MRAPPILALPLVLLVTALCATLFAQSAPSVYQVVVNPNNPSSAVDREFLEDAFLKKIATWPSGEAIRPVDLAPESPVRRRFSEEILRRSVDAVKGYWQQRIFSGRDVPPPELDTSEDVVKYVLRYEGAVGYVSGSAKLEGVKVVSVR